MPLAERSVPPVVSPKSTSPAAASAVKDGHEAQRRSGHRSERDGGHIVEDPPTVRESGHIEPEQPQSCSGSMHGVIAVFSRSMSALIPVPL